MDTVAASGGYITAIAADHIVARGNTITGSIGVIFSFPEISKLLDTLGIKMEEIKSGELKAEPSPYKPVSDKVRAVSNEMVQDIFAWFTGLVAERRNLSRRTGRRSRRWPCLYRPPGRDRKAHRRRWAARRWRSHWLASDKKIPKDLEVVELGQSRSMSIQPALASPLPISC